MNAIGLIANPYAGSDIRRLASPAPFRTEAALVAAVGCIVAGAVEAGVADVWYLPDRRGVVERAISDSGAHAVPAGSRWTGTRQDTRRAAAAMGAAGVGAVVVLGGDGTHRDVALGWRDAPTVAMAAGTNNVFPSPWEPTVAGLAAGAVALGSVPLGSVARQALVADTGDSLALVDLAQLDGAFTGSRAVLDVSAVRELVLPFAEPGRVGLSAIGAAVRPSLRSSDGGVHVVLDTFPRATRWVRAPLLPGRFDDVGICDDRALALDEPVVLRGPGVLAFDGEREVVLGPGDAVTVRIRRAGPWVIDPVAAATLAASPSQSGGRRAG